MYAIWEEPEILREFVNDLVYTGGPEADDEDQEEQRRAWLEELSEGWDIEDMYEDDWLEPNEDEEDIIQEFLRTPPPPAPHVVGRLPSQGRQFPRQAPCKGRELARPTTTYEYIEEKQQQEQQEQQEQQYPDEGSQDGVHLCSWWHDKPLIGRQGRIGFVLHP